MRKKNNSILLRLSDDELSELNQKVSKSGLTRSCFIRKMIKEQEIRELPPIEFFDILKQLAQINNSLNQIATKAHSLHFIEAPEYRRNYEMLQDAVGKIIRGIY